MRLSKDILDKPIISVDEGRHLGKAKDLLVDKDLTRMTGIFIKREGMFRRKTIYIPQDSVVVFGIDAILIESSQSITDSRTDPMGDWVELKSIYGREIDTPGGTKLATLGDVILNNEAMITGFTLGKVYVSGTVAENRSISRGSLVDTGHEDGTMTIDLDTAERLGVPDDVAPIIDNNDLLDRPPLEEPAAGAAPISDPLLDIDQPIASPTIDIEESAVETGGSQLDEMGMTYTPPETGGESGGADLALDPPDQS